VTSDRLPLGWPILSGVCVTPAVAAPLLALCDHGRRWADTNGVRLSDDLRVTLAALEAVAKQARGESPASGRPAVRWITVAEAARRVGVSSEAVRKAGHAGRLSMRAEGRRLFVDEAAVNVWARSPTVANRRQPEISTVGEDPRVSPNEENPT
jgi:excisionase family DNA binding protein